LLLRLQLRRLPLRQQPVQQRLLVQRQLSVERLLVPLAVQVALDWLVQFPVRLVPSQLVQFRQ
jgi:hypothetical protein